MSREYLYSYKVRSTFVPNIDWHFFKLRAVPCSNAFQHVVTHRLEVMPSCCINSSTDGLGNNVQWGSYDYDHSSFLVVSEGVVRQECEYAIAERPEPYYLAETHLTTCDDDMKLTAQTMKTPLEIMHWVHNRVEYTPCSTTVSTTASEVFHNRKGVCQDFAHLMIALCRAAGYHARYVNGLIMGEGQTHAWVEVSDGNVWHAFDPTHDKEIRWDYVKIAHGRDANDCPTNRGRMYMWTSETMTVEAKLIINN